MAYQQAIAVLPKKIVAAGRGMTQASEMHAHAALPCIWMHHFWTSWTSGIVSRVCRKRVQVCQSSTRGQEC